MDSSPSIPDSRYWISEFVVSGTSISYPESSGFLVSLTKSLKTLGTRLVEHGFRIPRIVGIPEYRSPYTGRFINGDFLAFRQEINFKKVDCSCDVFFPQSVLSSLQLLNMALWKVQATSTALSIKLAASVGIPSWEKIFCTVQRKACGMGVFLNVSKVKRSDSIVMTSIIKNWKLRASLAIYHHIFNAHSWNNC